MFEPSPSNAFPHEPYGSFNCEITIPGPVVGLVFILLVALAGLGAYKGVTAGHRGPGSSLLNPQSPEGKAVDASQAVPIIRDTDWSTLKGPQILTPPSAQPADKDADDQADSDAQDAADDAPKTITPPPAAKPAADIDPSAPDHQPADHATADHSPATP